MLLCRHNAEAHDRLVFLMSRINRGTLVLQSFQLLLFSLAEGLSFIGSNHFTSVPSTVARGYSVV